MSATFETGQHVRVTDHGRDYDGEIVKIGRVLLGIRYEGRTITFRQDTRHAEGTYTGPGCYFTTLEEVARQDRMRAARQALASHGVELSPRRTFTVEQAEALAEVVKTWEQENDR